MTILCTYIRVFVSCHSVTKNSLLLPFHLWIWYILLGTLSILIPFALGPIPGPFMTSYPFLETYSRQLEPEGTRLFCPFSFFFFFFFLINLFIFNFGCIGSLLLCVGFLYLWQVGATLRCGVWASHCSGFSCWGARALGTRASVVVACGLSSCGSRALEHRLSSCGARA